MRRSAVAWTGLALIVALLAAAAAFTVAADADLSELIPFAVLGGPFAVFGAFIAARQPAQRIGWLMLGIGLVLAISTACDAVVRYSLSDPGSFVDAGSAALLSAIAFNVFFLLLIVTILLLPSGQLPSPRWRVVGVAAAALGASDLLSIVRPGALDDWVEEGVRNPLGVEALDPLFAILAPAHILLTFILLLIAILSAVLRFRRSAGVERAQLRWIVTAVTAAGIALVVMVVGSLSLGDGRASDLLWAMGIFSIGLIPIGIGIAVLRYRLYEIDRVISRTLVYATVTAVLGASYVGLVLLGQALFSSFAGGSNLAIAVSTLLVAALFLPVRSRVQAFVDRRFYRRRYDAQRTLERFGARLREQVELDSLRHDLVAVVGETMQPAHAALWLREEAGR